MAKSKIQTAVPELAPKTRLTHNEAMSLVLAQNDLKHATHLEKEATLTLRAQELEAHIALTATRQALEKAKADVTQAKAKHDKLSEQLAQAYKFDWKTSGFEPLTGVIEELPVDTAQ